MRGYCYIVTMICMGSEEFLQEMLIATKHIKINTPIAIHVHLKPSFHTEILHYDLSQKLFRSSYMLTTICTW
jgi:hypothetical protein